jgi:hypothetical protein
MLVPGQRINLVKHSLLSPESKKAPEMTEIINLAVPYFGLIFIGFACGKAKDCPRPGSSG